MPEEGEANGNNNSTNNPQEGNDYEGVPDELKGKTPSEIAAFYQDRETRMTQRMDEMVRNNQAQNLAEPPPPPPPPANNTPSPTDWWNNPGEAVKKVAVTREEFNAAALSVQRNMIEVAQMLAAKRFGDWPKWENEVMKVMNTLQPHMRTDPEQWVTAYYYVKGHNYDKGVQEAVVNATRLATESPSPTPSEPVMPKELTKEQKYVANGLGLSEDKYRQGVKNQAEDKWPITFDSRKRKGA
jgi:hypothetical protein